MNFIIKHIREAILFSIFIISFGILFLFDPIPQIQSYHDFADKRFFLGFRNFLDIITNIFFLITGILGLFYCINNKQNIAYYWSWITFFGGVILVSFGSGYYHWNPNDSTLFWDRLPMTVGFMGLFSAILNENIHPQIERFLLIPVIMIGLASAIVWHYLDDLRFYYWVQLIPLLIILIIMILFKSQYSHKMYLLFALISYLLAKVVEIYDKEIFSFTTEIISGHSLKHIFASVGIFVIYIMLMKRQIISNPIKG